MGRAMKAAFADLFVDQQNEEHVRSRIKRGDFSYAIRLMKDWFRRKPKDIEVLRGLKAYLIQRRAELRLAKAAYARTLRKNRRAKRAASDTRVCVVCGKSIAHKRAGAETCSPKCRVKKCRDNESLTPKTGRSDKSRVMEAHNPILAVAKTVESQ